MPPKEISSLQHPLVKSLVKLREDKNERKQQGLVLVSGEKLVSELAKENPLDTLLLPTGRALPSSWRVKNFYQVTPAIFKKITGLVEPELIAATLPLPRETSMEHKRWVLALDRVGDPGNLGTLLRTALALGWEGAFLLDGCADPFNDKAIRAAKGATFRLPFCWGSPEKLLLQTSSLAAWAADLDGVPLREIKPSKGALLILGSESHGISPVLKERCQKVTIPMPGDMESLNVAAAGAILLQWIMMP